jgi:hypothetical protein
MAAGAIPPPLFFEQRDLRRHFGSRAWHPQEHWNSRTLEFKNTLENTTSVDHAI